MNYDQIITTITSIIITALVTYAVALIKRMVINHETFTQASTDALQDALKIPQQTVSTPPTTDKSNVQ